MPFTIRQVGPCFAGEVDGIDLTKPLPPQDIAAIHAGMDGTPSWSSTARISTTSSSSPSRRASAPSSSRSAPA